MVGKELNFVFCCTTFGTVAYCQLLHYKGSFECLNQPHPQTLLVAVA